MNKKQLDALIDETAKREFPDWWPLQQFADAKWAMYKLRDALLALGPVVVEGPVECPNCASRNLIPMKPRDPAIHRPGIMCLECSAFFEEAVESGCTEFEEINDCPAGNDTHLIGFWENLGSAVGEPHYVVFLYCPLCGTRLQGGEDA
jgi:DNA-directed RNA polymerase subunit RPC12/RpoP